jgi:hypothetical protein
LGFGARKKDKITQNYPNRGGDQTEEEAHCITSKEMLTAKPCVFFIGSETWGPVGTPERTPQSLGMRAYEEGIGAKKHLVLGSLSHTGSGLPLGSFTIR